MFNFEIKNLGLISGLFLSKGISSFDLATKFIHQLPYGRNANKYDLTTIFIDQCGTCSTKHAILKELANENKVFDLRLLIGIYRMNGSNTPPAKPVLSHFNLDYIPEAHCYLKYQDSVLDFTKISEKPLEFLPDLLEEQEISPDQITDYKVDHHRQYLFKWLCEHPDVHYNTEQIWSIREKCILSLSD